MVVGVLEGNEAIAVVRTMLGATNGVAAAPGTIRGDFSISKQNNLIHGSDSPESAEREIALWFRPEEVVDYAIAGSQWVFDGARVRTGSRSSSATRWPTAGRPDAKNAASSPTRSTCVLLVASTLFVLTALGYLVSPYVLEPGRRPGPGRGRSIALADWLDRNGPLALGVEFVVDDRRRRPGDGDRPLVLARSRAAVDRPPSRVDVRAGTSISRGMAAMAQQGRRARGRASSGPRSTGTTASTTSRPRPRSATASTTA